MSFVWLCYANTWTWGKQRKTNSYFQRRYVINHWCQTESQKEIFHNRHAILTWYHFVMTNQDSTFVTSAFCSLRKRSLWLAVIAVDSCGRFVCVCMWLKKICVVIHFQACTLRTSLSFCFMNTVSGVTVCYVNKKTIATRSM